MSTKIEDKVINGVTYTVTQWPAETAILNKIRLAAMFGPTIAEVAVAALKKDGDTEEAVAGSLSNGIGLLFRGNSPADVLAIIKDFICEFSMKDGSKIMSINNAFGPNEQASIYQLFFFVLQVNYADLIPGQLVDRLLAKVQVSLGESETSQTS